MHFRHYYYLDSASGVDYDGGVVEYSTNGGTSWQDVTAAPQGSLFSENGYTGTLQTGFQNPLAGRSAFTGYSTVFYSSRLALNSLAGQAVRFRFRFGSDNSYSDDGWLIDDVRVYTCVNSTTAALTSSSNPSAQGSPVTFTATVTASAGGTPTGTVTFKDGATILGPATLNGSGVATYTTSSLTAGSHQIRAVYGGDTTFGDNTSDGLAQQVNVVGCANPLQVTLNTDGNGCGMLRLAVTTANSNPPGSKIIDLSALSAGTEITLTLGGLTLGAGVNLSRTCGTSGPDIIIKGAGLDVDGLTLNGATVAGLYVHGFGKRQVVANTGDNKLSCFKTAKS